MPTIDRKHTLTKESSLEVRVTARSSHNKIIGILSNGVVKIQLTAPPVEGKANQALLKFLAKVLDIPIYQLRIISGLASRDKVVSVTNMEKVDIQTKIMGEIK